MGQRPFFVNASRGEVVDSRALSSAIDAGRFSAVALDVWENEPDVAPDLVRKADVATPHVAGYSYDGKVRGTEMILAGLCRFLGVDPPVDVGSLKEAVEDPVIGLDNGAGSEEALVRSVLRRAYDLDADDARMRGILDLAETGERARYFDMLRRTYPVRREFANYRVRLSRPDARLAAGLSALGFGAS
jgi:erythronate-4-phosphate dehydrogenase